MMDRYFYEDTSVPEYFTRGTVRFLIYDRRRGASEEAYAIASCADPDMAARIVRLLNADAAAVERQGARVA
jgi:hypothetical protein